MKLHPADVVLWALLSVAEAILVCVILKRNAARRWPFLLALSLFDLILTSQLLSHLGNYRAYFYIYWWGHGVKALLMLGLLWDVFRKFPELKYVPKNVGLMLISAGLTVTIGSVFLTSLHHPNTWSSLIAEVLLIHECVTVLWMAAAISLLKSVSFLGLGWGIESVDIAAGAVAFGLAGMVAASLTSWRPHYGPLFDKLQTCTEIAVFLSWIKTLISLPGKVEPDSALDAVNEPLEESPLV